MFVILQFLLLTFIIMMTLIAGSAAMQMRDD